MLVVDTDRVFDRRSRCSTSELAPIVWSLIGLALVVAGCSAESLTTSDEIPRPLFSERQGGDATHQVADLNAFSTSAPDLTDQQMQFFDLGEEFFEKEWVAMPASTADAVGLGPVFNGVSCADCHVLAGRGAPPDPTSNHLRLGLTLRLSQPDQISPTGSPVPDPVYGLQLQDRSIDGVPAEGAVGVEFEVVNGAYADGTTYELQRPTYVASDLAFGPLAEGTVVSPRVAPPVFGMGLLEAIPESDVVAGADPDDDDGDGISGRPNMIVDSMSGNTLLGRFSWKASVASVQLQVADAFHTDIGVTTYFHIDDNCSSEQVECLRASSGPRPELNDGLLGSVTFFNRTLGVPAMRDADDPQVAQGADLFESFGCASCHTPSHVTGQTDVGVLTGQTIFPYTDLLLHDMGPELADGRTEFEASGSEWRTPPLWGLGLTGTTVINGEPTGEKFLLHDGRARTIEEAILWHGGEAEASREKFRLADESERELLLLFLRAL